MPGYLPEKNVICLFAYLPVYLPDRQITFFFLHQANKFFWSHIFICLSGK